MNSSLPNNTALSPVILAGAGPGDPDLLTVKALRAITEADIILHDALVDPRILALATGKLINVGKRCGRHALKQSEICALLVQEARTGARVLRLKGGDPMIFGRTNEEIAALRTAGINLTIIPGITAATAAAATLEASLTARDVARSVTFITGHASDGGLPEQDWAALARLHGTIAFYMGARHAGQIADRLIEAGLDPATPGMIVMNISRADETHRTARLIDLADGLASDDLTSPALILIGAGLDVARKPARPLIRRVKLHV
ncbi:uroporphyrin-III C-methyltransferase [Acidiphilium sp. MT5]